MASDGISGTSVFIVLVGSVLAYSGLKGKSVSNTVKAFLAGSPPTGGPDSGQLINQAGIAGVATSTGTAPSSGIGGSVGAGASGGGSPSANKLLGRMLAGPYGWATGQEWTDLDNLWTRESGWSNTADTRVTGAGGDSRTSSVFAYGIAQARPAEKYPKPGQPPDKGGIASPTVQIVWGLNYIRGRYGSASAAWAHEIANGWY